MATLAVGEQCPDFSLPDDAGQTRSLAEFSGRPFVLYFYPKDDTSGCTAEALQFTALAADFAAIGVPVLGVSPDSVKKHCRFRDKHSLAVSLLSDEDKSLIAAFGVWVEKSMYGRKYMGVERTTALIGKDGRIARLWPKVSVPGHGAEVLEAARELATSA
ncbi:peroxiredoxin [Consotaella salsifontis]|uniref:thioredoxin-dependent peroxiredoxin n=1 Tax=Consotaella salsifontis TaxID=1365950 RepID=A0A1T4LR33_9HYPH|nr:peroxiredoxin [Consotaella salsifontis]SJZ57111.1 peroxiredoxin Q/BCP [Consotaella salsifontis]